VSLTLKLIIAFAGLLTAGLAAVGFGAVHITGQAVERELERRVEHTLASVTGNPGFFILEASRRRAELRQVADISGFEIIVSRGDGMTLAGSSLPGESAARFLAVARNSDRFETTLDGTRYRCARVRHLGRALYLLRPAEAVERAKREVQRPILLISALGLVVAGALGAIIAGTVTRPLRRLAEKAAEVREGRLDVEIPGGGGREVRDLARAFEEMLTGLARYRERLVRDEKLATLGRFSAAVAHELRNPLSAIRMSLELMRDGMDEGARADLDLLLSEMARLDHSVEELLFFSGEPRYSLVPGDLAETVEDAVRMLVPLAEHLGVAIVVDVPDGRAPGVFDPARLRQAVMNLVLNAIHASPAGGAVTVAVGPGDSGGMRLWVTDEGPGVPVEIGDRLFEPFVTGREGGTGLGLSVTRSIARAHGGEVEVGREEGRTVFTMTLDGSAEE